MFRLAAVGISVTAGLRYQYELRHTGKCESISMQLKRRFFAANFPPPPSHRRPEGPHLQDIPSKMRNHFYLSVEC
jgi:hypothetical protein